MNSLRNALSLEGLHTSEKSSWVIQLGWISFFTLATIIGAQIQIPHEPIPYTLQTFFVMIGAAFLGARNGAISQGLYLLLGAIGLPVFALGGFGIERLLGPTGGYLLSFPIAAFVIGSLVRLRSEYWWILCSFFAGLLIIFSCGTLFLHFVHLHNFPLAFSQGFLIFSWWDVVKLLGAASIYRVMRRK